MKAILIGLACLFLTGCRGDSAKEGERTPQPSTPAEPRGAGQVDPRPVIVAFGDSLTAGFGVGPGESYPDFLQKMIDEAGYRYRVVNAGISGDTTGGGLSRVDTVIRMQPEIVILELGANDGLRGLPVDSARANLKEIIVRLEGAGAQVVLAGMTLPRNYGMDYIRRFERMFTELAEEHSLPLIPFFLEGVADSPALMQQDLLHPTAEGNRRTAANVMRTLEPLLRQRDARKTK